MASEYFGLNRGDSTMQPDKVQTGTSTNSTDIELRIDLTKGLTRLDAQRLVEAIVRYIVDGRDSVLAL